MRLSEPQLAERSPELDMAQFNVTVVGNFNPAIIQPEWAMAQKIIPGGEYEVLAPVGLAGVALTYRIPDQHLGWTGTTDRLVVFGDLKPSASFISGVLEALPHTPLRAAGVNFQVAMAEKTARLRKKAPDLSSFFHRTKVGEVGQWLVVHLSDEVKLTMKRSWSGSHRVTHYNFHLDATDFKVISQHAASAESFKSLVEEVEAQG